MLMTIYSRLDKLLPGTKKALRREFNRLSVMGFDELNVLNTKKATKELFERLVSRNQKMYLDSGYFAYRFAFERAEEQGFRGEKRKIDNIWVQEYLKSYNPITRYIYDQETDRRRMRLNEAILTDRAFNSREDFQADLRKAASYWWRQTTQYGIGICDQAMLDAYIDSGVQKVVWRTMEDGRVCDDCDVRDGVVYDINKVLPKEHYGCRCVLLPVGRRD